MIELDEADIAEAWRGFRGRLHRKNFPRSFITSHSEELFAQAVMEMAQADARGVDLYSVCGWLIECAWRRAINLLDSQLRRPQLISIDVAATLPGSGESTPEEAVVAQDGQRRLHEAIGLLLPAERQIIVLIYLEGMSCRRAANILGWSTSKADRWHAKALGRLRELYGSRWLRSNSGGT